MLPVIVIDDALRLFSPGGVSISVDTALCPSMLGDYTALE